jgi:hypothetical protein
MESIRIWGYPRLCLCLIFSGSLLSRVVKRPVDAVKPEGLLSAAHVYWDVEIQLKINVMGLGSSGNSSSFLSPYAVNQLTDNYHQAVGLLLHITLITLTRYKNYVMNLVLQGL